MQMRRRLSRVACLTLILFGASAAAEAQAGSWYFAVSGDSRDCGDAIMPRIARRIADHAGQNPVSFYWHLGDFRAIYRVDCDYGKRLNPSFRCRPSKTSLDQTATMFQSYLDGAWDDFKNSQVAPFAAAGIPVFLGIGNHELAEHRTRADFRSAFESWLKQDWIQAQRAADRQKGITSMDGDTFYHFVRNGVDFIYLDNAAASAFQDDEVTWLSSVLNADAADDSIKTIIVGMHEALPGSTSKNHAMDAGACADVCVARGVYERLYAAQNLSGPASKRKNVYVFASHSHYIQENVYATPDHPQHVLKGWIVGTGGAEQYNQSVQQISYGYLLVEVRPDGTVNATFQKVTRNDPPASAAGLSDYCFGSNNVGPPTTVPDACLPCAPGPHHGPLLRARRSARRRRG